MYRFIVSVLSSALLFPDNLDGYHGFKDYFYERKGWFLGILAFNSAIDFANPTQTLFLEGLRRGGKEPEDAEEYALND
jgi:hypothetical protein